MIWRGRKSNESKTITKLAFIARSNFACHTNCDITTHWFDASHKGGDECTVEQVKNEKQVPASARSHKLKTLKRKSRKWENWNSKANRSLVLSFPFSSICCVALSLWHDRLQQSCVTTWRESLHSFTPHGHTERMEMEKRIVLTESKATNDDTPDHITPNARFFCSSTNSLFRKERTPTGNQTFVYLTCFMFNLAATSTLLLLLSAGAEIIYWSGMYFIGKLLSESQYEDWLHRNDDNDKINARFIIGAILRYIFCSLLFSSISWHTLLAFAIDIYYFHSKLKSLLCSLWFMESERRERNQGNCERNHCGALIIRILL